jgi:hypothetical protein
LNSFSQLLGSLAAVQQSQLGQVAKGSPFAEKQSLGMTNIAQTTLRAVGPSGVLKLLASVGFAGYAFYKMATEGKPNDSEDSQVVLEYLWDYARITEGDIKALVQELSEDD